MERILSANELYSFVLVSVIVCVYSYYCGPFRADLFTAVLPVKIHAMRITRQFIASTKKSRVHLPYGRLNETAANDWIELIL